MLDIIWPLGKTYWGTLLFTLCMESYIDPFIHLLERK